jgi:hypothetical protein
VLLAIFLLSLCFISPPERFQQFEKWRLSPTERH